MVPGTSLKPDLILEKNGHLLILDVTRPFEDGADTFKNGRTIKQDKYKPLLKHLRSKYCSIQIEAIIGGFLGPEKLSHLTQAMQQEIFKSNEKAHSV